MSQPQARLPTADRPGLVAHLSPRIREWWAGGVVVAGLGGVLLLLGGCSPAADSPPAVRVSASSTASGPGDAASSPPNSHRRAGEEVGVVSEVVDGDTVRVGGVGTIRLIGIDTPERGECGHDEATLLMRDLVLGREVTLVPGARDDRDRYDRLLRYVDVAGQDAGLAMIKAGLAVARYDSRDGFGRHPRQDRYIAADAVSPDRTQEDCAGARP